MTERGLPIVDGPAACPFVAFVDDRDERSTSPDHRHRCYAEATPAPRALAHQEAYCLASAFPVCPTFQDWAKREAARARADSGSAGEPIPGLSDERPTGGHDARLEDDDGPAEEPVYEDRPRKSARRDWMKPPPWVARGDAEEGSAGAGAVAGAAGAAGLAGAAAAGAAAAGAAAADAATPGAGGLSGSFADRLASPPGRQRTPVWRTGDAWDDELDEHGVPASAAAAAESVPEDEPEAVVEEAPPPPPRRSRERERAALAADDDAHERRMAPSWERPARLETFPSLRSRGVGGLNIPTLALAAVAVILAAILLFFLPGLLGLGGGNGGASPTPSVAGASPSTGASLGPTQLPAATQQVYLVQSGDTMSKIARKFGVPLQTLIDANKTTIPNPNALQIGQQVIIPAAVPSALPGASASP